MVHDRLKEDFKRNIYYQNQEKKYAVKDYEEQHKAKLNLYSQHKVKLTQDDYVRRVAKEQAHINQRDDVIKKMEEVE